FVHQLAARRVDQYGGRLHQLEAVRVDEMMRLVGQRDVQGDDVGRADQLIDREQADVHFAGAFGRQIRVVTDDLHAERTRQLCDVAADPPQAHDAHRLAAQLCPFEAL